MKFAVISDIHSNLPALEEALRIAEKAAVERIFCLGDLVGYGADPGACVDLVRQYCDLCVMGNHDVAVGREHGLDFLPRYGRKAAVHNRKKLSDDQLDYLVKLPYKLKWDRFTFVHATPDHPHRWQRMDSFLQARDQFDHFDTDICFVGHTHTPGIMANRLGVNEVREGLRYLINVGSVGQPRDGNPQLSMGLFETTTFSYQLVREDYDIDRAVSRIAEEKLPAYLGKRLRSGE